MRLGTLEGALMGFRVSGLESLGVLGGSWDVVSSVISTLTAAIAN